MHYLCDELKIKVIKWSRGRIQMKMKVYGSSDVAEILHRNHRI
jgi:hypothetical protein